MTKRNLSEFFRRFGAVLAAFAIVLGMSTGSFLRANASSTASTEASTETASSGDYSYIRNWEEYTQQKQPAYVEGTWKFHDIRDAIVQVLEAGKKAMEAGDYETGHQAGSDGYYGFYDLAFENATNMYISGSRVKQLELLFGQLRTLGSDGNTEEYEQVCDTIEQYVNEDADKLDGEDLDSSSDSSTSTSDSSGTTTAESASASTGQRSATMLVFLGTFFDILREGLEAILVVAAIIAYLQVQVRNGSADRKKTLYPVYIGAVLGIVCSFIMAWILNLIKSLGGSSSHQQEFVEGITALVAVCVLFWTCNWMLSKSETEAWTAYIKTKTQTGSKNGSVFALAFASFLAVFREGAEAVLFLQPYLRNPEQTAGVIWGLILAGVCLVIIYMLIILLSVKLPMRIFFTATSILMAVMCVCFLGSGISELIEAEVLGAYSAPWVAWIPLNNSVLDVLGIYPYVNTIVPQIILAVILIVMFRIGFKKNRQIRELSDARKAVDAAKKTAEDHKAAAAEFRTRTERIVYEILLKEGTVKALPETVLTTQKAAKDAEAADEAAIAAAEAKYQKLEKENEERENRKKAKKK